MQALAHLIARSEVIGLPEFAQTEAPYLEKLEPVESTTDTD